MRTERMHSKGKFYNIAEMAPLRVGGGNMISEAIGDLSINQLHVPRNLNRLCRKILPAVSPRSRVYRMRAAIFKELSERQY